MLHLTDNELLVELRAKRDWLRANPTGMAASTTKRRMKEIERELASRGVDVDAESRSQRSRLALSVWYVVDQQPTTSRAVHADRDCLHLMDSRVREATQSRVRASANLLDLWMMMSRAAVLDPAALWKLNERGTRYEGLVRRRVKSPAGRLVPFSPRAPVGRTLWRLFARADQARRGASAHDRLPSTIRRHDTARGLLLLA